MSDIQIFHGPITKNDLDQLPQHFENMIKGVIDIHTNIIALGGSMHADEEALLLQNGATQDHLWGFNIYTDEIFRKRSTNPILPLRLNPEYS